MTGDKAEQNRTSMRVMAAIGLAAIILVLVLNALLRGPWLDEFWTLQLSDTRGGLFALTSDGWLHDTHPPFFNIWATLLASVGISSIPAGRLFTNLPALLAMIYASRCFTRRRPDQLGFHAAFLLLILSVPATVAAFANYRSYFWQIAALAMLVQLARHVAMAEVDLRRRRDGEIIPPAVAAVAGSIMIHYIGGIFGAVLTAAIILCALAKGFRRWAWLLIWTAMASGLFTAGFASIQAGHWTAELDYNWIDPREGTAVVILAGLAILALVHNPVPVAGLWRVRRDWTKGDSIFMAAIMGSLLFALFLLLQINVQKPVIAGRYVVGVSVLVCALVAPLGARLAQDKRLFGLMVLFSVGVVIVPFVLHGPDRQWEANAKRIAQIQAQCPSTKVYAASAWLLRDGANSQAARREEPVFAHGYARLGESEGFSPISIGRNGPTQAVPGACPTLLWIEHIPVDAKYPPAKAIAAAGLSGLDTAKLSLIRSESGFIVRADRP